MSSEQWFAVSVTVFAACVLCALCSKAWAVFVLVVATVVATYAAGPHYQKLVVELRRWHEERLAEQERQEEARQAEALRRDYQAQEAEERRANSEATYQLFSDLNTFIRAERGDPRAKLEHERRSLQEIMRTSSEKERRFMRERLVQIEKELESMDR